MAESHRLLGVGPDTYDWASASAGTWSGEAGCTLRCALYLGKL